MRSPLRSIPDFVLRDPGRGAGFGIPLLMFHWLSPSVLTEYLLHLQEAGYQSLSADEIAAIARGDLTPPSRAVALTFDDGVYNNWAVVAPLLRRHGFHGIAFVIPRLLAEGPPRPTIEDLGDDGNDRAVADPLDDEARGRYLRWSEVEALAADGCLEIQSHTWDHAQVFTSPEIIDFQHPRADGRPRYPWLWSAVGAQPGEPLWGAPVYPAASRMEARRYHDDPALRAACLRFVAVRGGSGYLRDETWREELERFALATRGMSDGGQFEEPGAADAARLTSLRQARVVLSERLGRPVEHVALPWSRGVAHAKHLIRDAGYQSGYTREVASGRLRPGDDPYDLPRLEGYWLGSLPGPGRVSLAARVIRRARGRP